MSDGPDLSPGGEDDSAKDSAVHVERSPSVRGVVPVPTSETRPGFLSWMTQNAVAANLIMIALVLGGLFMLPSIKQEVFPEFELDMVMINVGYPGASPSDVEKGVLLSVEEAVREVEGVDEVRSTAAEGAGVVTVELLLGTNQARALADIKSAVDRIQSFPADIERPVVSLAQNRKEVISLVVHGDTDERSIRTMAERVREDLLALDEIDVVELYGARPYEISIEVPRQELRSHNLTLEQIARRVSAGAVETPGGGVKTAGGEVLVRTSARKDYGPEFASIPIISRPDGSQLLVGDMARVDDGFQETDQEAYFNGERAIMVKVFRVGDQTPITVADAVYKYVDAQKHKLPSGIHMSTWADMSEIYAQRVDLLRRNAIAGLVLVIVVLGMFLDLSLAFWVTAGIPISFIGSLLLMPGFDASINMISLFAFIVTLGMVVDDAIVVGEAVYARRTQGIPFMEAAIGGVREVAWPVVFSVSTTVIAFAPMLFVPGPSGKFFRLIPIVVISVLVISLVESLLVLPAHLSHPGGLPRLLGRMLLSPLWLINPRWAAQAPVIFAHKQQSFAVSVEGFIDNVYQPMLRSCLKQRYITLATCIAIMLATTGLLGGGFIKFTFMPKVDGDVVVADLRMPFGTPPETTRAVVTRIEAAAEESLHTLESGHGMERVRGIFAQMGDRGSLRGGGIPSGRGAEGGHVGEVAVYLVPTDDRTFTSREFSEAWRDRIGDIPGVESLKFSFNMGPSAGSPIDVELEHQDLGVLELAANDLAEELRKYTGVYAIDSGFSPGKEQLNMTLKPNALALGLTDASLAAQLRSSFYGVEALRQQRGRDELRVYVRLPDDQRKSEFDLESLMLRTPDGGEIPLLEAVDVERGRSYTSIKRREGRRVVNVTADVDGVGANANDVIAGLEEAALPGLLERYDGLRYKYGGEQKEQTKSLSSLKRGFMLSLVGIFGLLAVAFRSYFQPLIIMTVIPFGIVGALLGHWVLGYDLSLISLMGVVALSGVVVNDSLILIVAINTFRAEGMDMWEAIVAGGLRRFRPIILTSLTTFFGLVPMIFETSVQARFLIPMAISLGFGVLVATLIMLVLVPAIYAISEDIKLWLSRVWQRTQRGLRALEGPAE